MIPWALAVALLAQPASGGPASTGQAAVQRPDETVAAPSDWLRLSGMQRTRFESLDGQFRAAGTLDASDHLLALRTTLLVDADLKRFNATAEFWDARQFAADAGSVVDPTIVNSAEIVQLFFGYRSKDVFAAGDKASVILGRHTMDLGSRRLVARNDFRNTTNTFFGLNARWESRSNNVLQAFFTLPTRRLPSDTDSLLDSDAQLDEESRHIRFWGLHGTFAHLVGDASLELYYLGLDEQDAPRFETANRSLATVGARLVKRPASGRIDYEIEAAWQSGTSRASTASGVDLDHRAEFVHIEGGYTFAHAWKPRVVLQFDYASGDGSPMDGENNRFDTLFGARRWEFGPTGIFGAISRSNVITPGLRLLAQPRQDVALMAAHRAVFLQSATDAYVAGGVRDPGGGSGDHVGNLTEVRVRWHVAPRTWTLEFGGAYHAAGNFLERAPNASGNGDTTYAYFQSVFNF